MGESLDYMDTELRFFMSLTRRLPNFPRITALVNRLLKPFYLRRPRKSVVCDVEGLTMLLNPKEAVDGALLFYWQIYDRMEIGYLQQTLKPGQTFLDLGSYIGYYSLQAARLVGGAGRVLAVEAEPSTFRILQENIRLNGYDSIIVPVNAGLADQERILRMAVQKSGNRGGSSFFVEQENAIEIQCYPLLALLRKHGIERVAGAKIDIESMEFRVLKAFFETAPEELWPGFIILEYFPENDTVAGGNSLQLVLEYGYSIKDSSAYNYILVRKAQAD